MSLSSSSSSQQCNVARAPPPTEPTIYKHLHKVTSGITGEPVTDKTPIATLYRPRPKSTNVNDTLLRNLTGIAEPAVRCGMTVGDGIWYPATPKASQSGYDMFMTYNKLMFAPCIRVECRFVQKPGEEPYHVTALEFPLHTPHAKNFQVKKDGDTIFIRFKARGASASGFNRVPQFSHKFGDTETEVIDFLKGLVSHNGTRSVKFQFSVESLSQSTSKQLESILSRFPGGNGTLLPSFNVPAYHMFGKRPRIRAKYDTMRGAYDLMTDKVPFPMVALACPDTFASVKEASVQLAYACYFANKEAEVGLELWADGLHEARLYSVGTFPILAVNFGKFRRLGGNEDKLRYRLPEEVVSKIVFPSNPDFVFEGYLESETLGLPPHDAFFVVTNRIVEEMKAVGILGFGDESVRYVEFRPNYRRSTYIAQLGTVMDIQQQRNQRWHPILLNQLHDEIPTVDMTADIDTALVQEADLWLHSWVTWNQEQRQIMDSIHDSKGGLSITMGIAGTGKSLVQSSLAMYFVKLGYKCLICTPANSNADQSTNDIHAFVQGFKSTRHTGKTRDLSTVRIHRLYSMSRDYGLRKISQATKQCVTTLHGLELKLQSRKDRKVGARQHGIEQAVIEEAEKGELIYITRLKSPDGQSCSDEIDAWEVFRDYLNESRNGLFDWDDAEVMAKYCNVYQVCRDHLLGLTDIIATTTGNGRCEDVVQSWADVDKRYKTSYKGIIVLCDEAAKDLEINTWIPIVAMGDLVKGVFLFGDEKQLKPVNTCARGDIQFNPFYDRLNTPLTDRLIREGFPCVHLHEQNRMHPCISNFPNSEFYSGTLRDGPKVQVTLEQAKPRLSEVLHGILSRKVPPPPARPPTGAIPPHRQHVYKFRAIPPHRKHELENKPKPPSSDEIARHAYLEIEGRQEKHPRTGSKVVRAHVDLFFKYVFPDLQAFFGNETSKDLMIICAYSYAVQHYKGKIHELQQQQGLPASHYPSISDQSKFDPDLSHPRVHTIDSAQGQESFMVILDGSFQHCDDMGFMIDPGRSNVAMTRAKGVFWIIGGPLNFKSLILRPGATTVSPFTRLKEEMRKRGKVHKFRLEEQT